MGDLMRAAAWPTSFPPSPHDWADELQVAVSLVLNVRFPMFLLWGEHRACLYNDGCIPLLGDRHPAALGRPYRDIWPEIEPLIRRAMGGEAQVFDDLPLTVERRAHAERACFTFSCSPLYDRIGTVSGMFCACTETTEKVNALAALRESRDALKRANAEREARVTREQLERDRAWRLSRDIIAVASLDGYFRSVNPAFAASLGWSDAETLSMPFAEFVHPEEGDLVAGALAALRDGRSVSQLEARVRHKNGGFRWFSWTVVPEGDSLSVVGRDVTDDKEQRKALADAEDALRHAQKIEAVGQLTGGIAHDFNNILTGITASLEMMRRRAAQGRSADIDRFVVTAINSANRAAALTHRLLAFSRRQSLDPKPVDADHLLRELEELLRRTMGETIRLDIVSGGGLWLTHCDPHQLENAILNLVINARDAMPDGGRITIETRNTPIDESSAARSGDIRPGRYVCVSVTDTGTGMPPEVMNRAFDPFFTTKPIGQGTGLGLSMIYGFARQSEGAVRISSQVGRGTSVEIYLPRHEGPTEADGAGQNRPRPTVANPDRVVLVVEDETMIRDLVMDIVEDLGLHVLEAHDGPSGLRIVQSDIRIDLLVTDVGLPGFDGRRLADAARLVRPDLRVLFMTGYAHNAAVGNGLLEPGMQIITKPFAIDVLSRRIVDALAG